MSVELSAAWITITPIVVGISGGVLSYINYFYSRKKDRLNSVLQAFGHLNTNQHREARRVIYYLSKELKGDFDIRIPSQFILGFDITTSSVPDKESMLLRVCKDIVRDDMDEMGLMIKSKQIPEKEFLERYWKTVIDCRWLLDFEIAERRRIRNYNQYVIHFDYLTDKACVYAKQNRLLAEKWANRCNIKWFKVEFSTSIMLVKLELRIACLLI